MAKVLHFRETSHLFTQYQEDIRKLEVHMWEAGQMKDASARRLEGANALHRIEEALVEINCRQQRRQPLAERGRSTWKGGDVTKRCADSYYTVMTHISK